MQARFITVGWLMRECGISFGRAETILREQTACTRRSPSVVLCHLGGFLMGVAGVPLLVPPQHRALAMSLRLGCLGLMVAGGIVLPRVLAGRAILDAALAGRADAG